MPDFSIGIYDFDFFEPVSYYYLSGAVVAVCLWVLWRIERSPVGLTFHAVHWQDKLAEASGVNLRAYRTLAFAIASGFAGVSGALLAHYVGTINPNSFDVEVMVFVLTWAIVGGTGTFYGPILGCVVLTILNEIVLREMGFEQMRPLIYGADHDPVDPLHAQRAGERGAEDLRPEARQMVPPERRPRHDHVSGTPTT